MWCEDRQEIQINHANYFIAVHDTENVMIKACIYKWPGIEVGGAPVTGVTETASTLTGLWFEGKLVIPERLKAPRASLKPSDIKIRKWGVLASSGGSAALLFRFPYTMPKEYDQYYEINWIEVKKVVISRRIFTKYLIVSIFLLGKTQVPYWLKIVSR